MAPCLILLNVTNYLYQLLLSGVRRKTEGNSLPKFERKLDQQLRQSNYQCVDSACQTDAYKNTMEHSDSVCLDLFLDAVDTSIDVLSALGLLKCQKDSECDSDFHSDPECN